MMCKYEGVIEYFLMMTVVETGLFGKNNNSLKRPPQGTGGGFSSTGTGGWCFLPGV